jgi:predicted hotdog family 3-hydroxylacyl-ACP dehydratase
MKTLPQSSAEIAALIPHQGSMCLIERVIDWNDEHIRCATHTHLQSNHPLRHEGRIAAVHLCEYGAQATAIHGALTATQSGMPAAPGMLVALRDVQLAVDYLDECPVLQDAALNTLQIEATQQYASAAGCMYEFSVSMNQQTLVRGKVTIITPNPS